MGWCCSFLNKVPLAKSVVGQFEMLHGLFDATQVFCVNRRITLMAACVLVCVCLLRWLQDGEGGASCARNPTAASQTPRPTPTQRYPWPLSHRHIPGPAFHPRLTTTHSDKRFNLAAVFSSGSTGFIRYRGKKQTTI